MRSEDLRNKEVGARPEDDISMIREMARRLGLMQRRSGRRAGGRKQGKERHAGKQTDGKRGKGNLD